jgi:ABC-type sugar transport system ATPase subunit
MNLVPALWDGGFAVVGEHRLALGEAAPAPRSVVVGIRPGDLRVADSGLPARVERIEDLGDSCVVSFLAGDRLLKLKSERLPSLREGDDVHVNFAPGAAHKFDRQTGLRL